MHVCESTFDEVQQYLFEHFFMYFWVCDGVQKSSFLWVGEDYLSQFLSVNLAIV